MKDLISVRARLRKLIESTEREYKKAEKASIVDDDSNSYDQMQRLSGRLVAFRYAHNMVKHLIIKLRK